MCSPTVPQSIAPMSFMENIMCLILGWVLPWFVPGAVSRNPNNELLVALKHKLEAEAETI
jgi:hypothetical protein